MSAPGRLGTFGGVFTPSVLTILGLVLFLRVGYVTGNVGLGQMLAILALATSVTVLTTISLAAIATNLRVGGGGVYFLISRTLGPAFGGAIGIVLYLAMSVSVAFYTIGLGEALATVLGLDDPSAPRAIAAITIVLLLGLAWLGADIATRLQYVVMVALVIALVAYFVGVGDELRVGRLSESFSAPEGGDSFWVAFALFFPAVTGFTQGVAMSGDLATPSKSISQGTFAAIGVSTIVYVLVIVTFVMAVPLDGLREETSIMRTLAPAPWLIDIGVIAATLSSAIASMMGAPRTLQRLAADRLVGRLEPFAVGAGPASNPRRGAALSAAIALGTVALGDLDVVAPIISMFFLASYGMINYATYSEARAGSTSFRPRFRFFDWRLSLLGTLSCLAAILAIDPLAGALAGLALFTLVRYLSRTVHQVRWADSTRGFHASEVRSHLAQMGPHGDPGRDWRPCTVAFAPRDPERRARLTTVATWFEGNAGFTSVARIVAGRGPMVRKRAARVELELQRELAARPATAYGRVVVGETREDGVAAMLQAHGIGALRPNLALFSWYHADDPARPNAATTAAMVQTAIRFGCSVGIAHTPDEAWERLPAGGRGRIAVWWPDDRTGQLLTLLAWMCTRTRDWDATIEIWVSCEGCSSPDDADAMRDRVADLVDDARIPAVVAGAAPPSEFAATVAGAHLVLAPLRLRHGDVLGPDQVGIDELVRVIDGVAVFAHAASSVALDVQPDDADAAALAAAHDRATELSARAEELSQRAGGLLVRAEIARLEHAGAGNGSARLVAEAEEAANRAQRTYLDARTRAEEAWRIVHEIDPTAATDEVDPQLWVRSDGP